MGYIEDMRARIGHDMLITASVAVLVSDGVTDGSEDEWVRQQIRAFQGDSPKDLAGALLQHDQMVSDDRTAIVLLMEGTQV